MSLNKEPIAQGDVESQMLVFICSLAFEFDQVERFIDKKHKTAVFFSKMTTSKILYG